MHPEDALVYSDMLASLARIAAGNRCQCANSACGHAGPCNAVLEDGCWRAWYRVPLGDGGSDTLDNCEVICLACLEVARRTQRTSD